MYDPTFGPTSLARHFKKSDFRITPRLSGKTYKQSVLLKATSIGKNGFSVLPIATNDLGGRTIYQINDLPSDLVLRKAG